MDKIRAAVGGDRFAHGSYRNAARLMDHITAENAFVPFLTLIAYDELRQ